MNFRVMGYCLFDLGYTMWSQLVFYITCPPPPLFSKIIMKNKQIIAMFVSFFKFFDFFSKKILCLLSFSIHFQNQFF